MTENLYGYVKVRYNPRFGVVFDPGDIGAFGNVLDNENFDLLLVMIRPGNVGFATKDSIRILIFRTSRVIKLKH